MAKELFRFKQFAIKHTDCAMKVGTDGVLLGLLAPSKNPTHILDIGTGTGLIALMLHQRFPQARITAIEPVKQCADEAGFNTKHAKTRLRVECERLQDFKPEHSFDLVVSNPPYFASENKGRTERNLARSSLDLTPTDIFSFCKYHLQTKGNLCLVYPFQDHAQRVHLASKMGLHVHQTVAICGRYGLPPKRIIASYHKVPCQEIEHRTLHLETDKRGNWSLDFRAIAKDFYLKL